MIPALRNIQDAIRIVLRIPGGTWSLHVTDEDGSGDDPLYSSLFVMAPSGQLEETLRRIGGDFTRIVEGDEGTALYIRNEGHLEITVEEMTT